MALTLHGSCHCQRLQLALHGSLEPAAASPRACDCSYCRAHAAAWLSDPGGELVVSTAGADAPGRYRQGSESAEFLFCRHCGVLVAVVFATDEGMRGAVNVRCLARVGEFAQAQSASPPQLAPEQRRERWRRLWMPVRIECEAGQSVL
jgi:hypothetical protein